MIKTIMVAAVTALVVSAIYGKVSAVHTFNVIDGYVKDLFELLRQSIRNASIDK